MICQKCSNELDMLVNVTLVIPSSLENLISKKAIATKAVKIMGVDWDAATYVCPKCGWHESGVLRYTKKLEARIKELEEQLLTK